MEPLKTVTSDWLKDYDPLFDLFEEEMRASEAVAKTTAAAAEYYYCYNNEYDLNNYYNDELSLMD